MATCDLGYEHEDAAPESKPAEPVVVETGPNENDVKIAEIQAEQSVETAKIYAEEAKDDLRVEVEHLRGEVTGMREVLERIAPSEPEPPPEPPAPEPVIVEAPVDGDQTPPPSEKESTGAKSGKSGGGWWADYH